MSRTPWGKLAFRSTLLYHGPVRFKRDPRGALWISIDRHDFHTLAVVPRLAGGEP